MTKPILHAINYCRSFKDVLTSLPQLISKLSVVPTCFMFAMLFLIGLALFYAQGVFV